MSDITSPPCFDSNYGFSICARNFVGVDCPSIICQTLKEMREQEIQNTCLKISELGNNGIIPTSKGYDTPGYNLYVAYDHYIQPHSKMTINLDIKIENNSDFILAVTSNNYKIKSSLIASYGADDLEIKIYNRFSEQLIISQHAVVAQLHVLDTFYDLPIRLSQPQRLVTMNLNIIDYVAHNLYDFGYCVTVIENVVHKLDFS